MQVTEKIAAFRSRMKDENFAAVIVPTADSHASEYIADHFKTRQWLSGFTGSAGTLVVTGYNLAGSILRAFGDVERMVGDTLEVVYRVQIFAYGLVLLGV